MLQINDALLCLKNSLSRCFLSLPVESINYHFDYELPPRTSQGPMGLRTPSACEFAVTIQFTSRFSRTFPISPDKVHP